jgi:hypothetical protein
MSNISDFLATAAGDGAGSTVEAFFPPGPAYIPADGSIVSKATYPELATIVGDEPLLLNTRNLYKTNGNTSTFYLNNSASQDWNFNIATDGTNFVAINKYSILFSPNGIKWKFVVMVTPGQISGDYFTQVKFTGNKFFAYRDDALKNIYYESANGETWTVVNTPFSFRDMTYDGTNYAFTDGGSSVYFGSNLLSLTLTNIGASAHNIEKIGNYYVSWASAASPSPRVSTNGTTWSALSVVTGLSNNYSIANNLLFVMCWDSDSTSRPLYAATDGATWSYSSTSFSRSSNAFQSSKSAVVFDGTTYFCGFRHNSSSSRNYYFTSVSGTATIINDVSGGFTYQASNVACYKPGTFLLRTGNRGCVHVLSASVPTTSWPYVGSNATFTEVPSLHGVNNSSAILAGYQSNSYGMLLNQAPTASSSTTPSMVSHWFIDDDFYFQSYPGGTNGTDIWVSYYNSSTQAPQSTMNANKLYVTYYTGSPAGYYFYNIDHTAKKLYQFRQASIPSSADPYWLIPRSSGILLLYSSATLMQIDDDGSTRTNTSIPGYTGTAITTTHSQTYNLDTNEFFHCGYHSSQPKLIYSTNGGQSFSVVFDGNPTLTKADGTGSLALTTNWFWAFKINGVCVLTTQSRVFIGGSFNAMFEYTGSHNFATSQSYGGVSISDYSLAIIHNANFITFGGNVFASSGGGESVSARSNESSNAQYFTAVVHNGIGNAFTGSSQSSSSPNYNSYSTFENFTLDTGFKLPQILPEKFENQVFVKTES